MIDIIEENKDLLDLLMQLLIIVLPLIFTWFVRTHVKSEQAQKRLASIVRLSNIAIDYAEDLDKRGDLDKYLRMYNVSEDIITNASRGIQKLNLAGIFVEEELEKLGVRVTVEEAKAWIASEFQSRVGDIGRERTAVERAKEAVAVLLALDESGLIDLTDNIDHTLHIADQVSEWILQQMDGADSEVAAHEVRLRVRKALVGEATPVSVPATAPQAARLEDLAEQAVRYVEELKQTHELAVDEVDVATGWLLTEATKRHLAVTAEQIARAVRGAMENNSHT
jgi:hypothetical protein